jgi:REP element-mobilizing transposase RayT
MNNDKFRNKYRIPSARAQWHEYDGGLYFVTVCTHQKLHYFGKIVGNEMILSAIGKYAVICIEELPEHFPDAEIPLYVVMPNHIHLIVAIDRETKTNHNVGRDVACNVSERKTENVIMSTISPKHGTLATIIRSLKSTITRYAHENQIEFSWQSRFYDHIIRDVEDCNRIAEYIENNVVLWDMDKLNK